MKSSSVMPLIVFGVVAGLAVSAGAGVSQTSVAAPGGFVQTGAYQTTTGSAPIPGEDMTVTYGLGQDFHELSFFGASSTQTAASFSTAKIHNSGSGWAGMGYARMSAFNTVQDSPGFPMGLVNEGWKETFMVDHPALHGQDGYLVFQIRARGGMHTSGLTGGAFLTTTGYKDNKELVMNPLFDRGTSDPIATSVQRAQWSLASYGTDDNRVVDSTVTMVVPITFGQSFTLGIYATGRATLRSSGSGVAISSGSLDFSGYGVTWNGIVGVKTAGGTPVSGYTIGSGSGIDWSTPFVQCVADLSGDGIVDFSDYLEFLNLFDAGDPQVDFNQDGIVDFSDYLEFLNLFETGC